MARGLQITPFPHQEEIIKQALGGTVNLLVGQAGRGAAKSATAMTIVLCLVAEFLKRGGEWTIWWITPTKTGTGKKPWRYFMKMFSSTGPFKDYSPRIDKQLMTIDIAGVHLAIKPANAQDSSTLEGDALNVAVYEEFGSKHLTGEKGRSMYNSIHPAVTRVNGLEIILGTPPRDWLECNKGIFRELWDEAGNSDPKSMAFQWRTVDNPVYGGVILDTCKTVYEMADMSEVEVDAYVNTWRDKLADEEIEKIYQKCLINSEKMKSLTILAKGNEEPERLKKEIKYAIQKRIETLKHIQRNIRIGQPEEAAREYEGGWLPRPQSIGEDILNWIHSCCYQGEQHIITQDGDLIEGRGSLELWERPQDGSDYVISVDPAGGGGRDYSVALIIKREQLKTNDETEDTVWTPAKIVGIYRTNKIAPNIVGIAVYHLSMFFNGALVAIERTGGWGVSAIVAMLNLAQKTGSPIWFYSDEARDAQLGMSAEDPNRYGWNTNLQSTGMALTTLRKYLHTRQVIIPSEVMYEELASFDWDKREGVTNDDTVYALAIGLQVMTWVKPEQMDKMSWEEEYEEEMMALANGVGNGYGENEEWNAFNQAAV